QLGVRSLGFQDFFVTPDAQDAPALDGQGLVDGELLIHGDDLAVVQDQVGVRGPDRRSQQREEGYCAAKQQHDAASHEEGSESKIAGAGYPERTGAGCQLFINLSEHYTMGSGPDASMRSERPLPGDGI